MCLEREREREREREWLTLFKLGDENKYLFFTFYFYISKIKMGIKGDDKNPYFVHNIKKQI